MENEYKERSERLGLATAVERSLPAGNVPRGQSPMKLLTSRDLSQTPEVQITAVAGRVTIPDPSDILGDPVVERTMQQLVETAGRLVANRSVPASGLTAPYGTIDDTGRVKLSSEVMKKTAADMRACFNRSTWIPTMNMQQPTLGTSHLISGDSVVGFLQNLRTSWITTVMASGGATIAQLYRMVELMNPGKIVEIMMMVLIGTNNLSKSSNAEEAQWESMLLCLFTTVWQKFQRALLIVRTIPLSTRKKSSSGRRHKERVITWNKRVIR